MGNVKLSLLKTDKNFQIIDIFLDGDGIIAPEDLKKLELPEDIEWEKGIILNGRAPIWLFVTLSHKLHPASWIAVSSPRDGGAVVVEVHNKNAQLALGDIIPNEKFFDYIKKKEVNSSPQKEEVRKHKIIAIIGPPHSGKSTLVTLLAKKIQQSIGQEKFHREFYVIRACPDGEGNWCYECPEELVEIIRYKNRWNEEFIQKITAQIENLSQQKSLLLVDCGGVIDKYNTMIFDKCDSAIIVSSDENYICEWRGAAKASNLHIIATIHSVTYNTTEVISTPPLQLRLGYLEKQKSENIILPDELISAILE